MWNSNLIAQHLKSVLINSTSASVTSFCVGACLSYLVTNKVVKKKYEELADREIDEARRFYKKGDYSDPVKALDKLEKENKKRKESVKLVKDLGYTNEFTPAPHVHAPEAKEEDLGEPEVRNVFVNNVPIDDNFDYEEELKNRDESYPYVISEEEFLQGEPDYSQNKMTWFEEDGQLVDDEDTMIPESDPIVGDSNLLRFGHGSKDNNVVYIRNERLEIDIEVVRDMGSYVKSVLGFDQESLEHSDRHRLRRMRSADE